MKVCESSMRKEAKAGLKSLVNPGHGSDLVTALGEAHKSGLFADVKLVCGDGPVWAHAATLAAVSPVLRYAASYSHPLLDSSVENCCFLIQGHCCWNTAAAATSA